MFAVIKKNSLRYYVEWIHKITIIQKIILLIIILTTLIIIFLLEKSFWGAAFNFQLLLCDIGNVELDYKVGKGKIHTYTQIVI